MLYRETLFSETLAQFKVLSSIGERMVDLPNHEIMQKLWQIFLWVAVGLTGGMAAAPVAGVLMFGGVERHYFVVLPDGYDGTIAAPVVFIFHWKNNDGALSEKTLGFTALQKQKYFIAVYPDGLNREWNGGRKPPASHEVEKSDDVGFVSALIDGLDAKYKIDLNRVYATGSSNGAIFCYTLAARLSDRIAAIGPVNGNIGVTIPERFPPKHAVSVISFNGTDDRMVPFGGDSDPVYGLRSTSDTVAFWVKVNGCLQNPDVLRLPSARPDDGTTIERLSFGKGLTNAEVVAFIIGHGGHTWPGNHTDPVWAKTAGKTAMGVKATEEIWHFFEMHPKSSH